MRKSINAGSALAIMTILGSLSVHPALAIPLAPPSVPEPSPMLGVGIGALVLAVCLFLRFRSLRHRSARDDA